MIRKLGLETALPGYSSGLIAALVAGVLAVALPATAWCDSGKITAGIGNIEAGRQKSASERCQECHGPQGISGDQHIPNHAGQLAAYLVKQLEDFQSGARQHDIMSLMAADLSGDDRADIAAFFAAQVGAEGEKQAVRPRGQQLFLNGDPTKNLPACAKCHGDKALGQQVEQTLYPRLAGQKRIYLRTQLVNWRIGDRHNSPDGEMNQIGKQLTDDDIDALADYLSALPSPP